MAITFNTLGIDYPLAGKRKIAAWIRGVIASEGFTPGDINYVFCSREEHLKINIRYLGHDYPTDVITFDNGDPACREVVCGDIFIDPLTVAENATNYSQTELCEALRVMVHGVLHLCGYDDHTDEDRAVMREKENFYLSGIRM